MTVDRKVTVETPIHNTGSAVQVIQRGGRVVFGFVASQEHLNSN